MQELDIDSRTEIVSQMNDILDILDKLKNQNLIGFKVTALFSDAAPYDFELGSNSASKANEGLINQLTNEYKRLEANFRLIK